MKKHFLAAAVLLCAAIGAFATSQKSATTLVWYDDATEGCIQVRADICGPVGAPGCVTPLFDASTSAPLGFSAQIYAAQATNPVDCAQPYSKP